MSVSFRIHLLCYLGENMTGVAAAGLCFSRQAATKILVLESVWKLQMASLRLFLLDPFGFSCVFFSKMLFRGSLAFGRVSNSPA